MEQLHKVASPCLDGHQFKQEELESVGELSQVCSQMVLNACTWHEVGDHTLNGLSTNLQEQSQNGLRHVTDDFARLISYIHHTNEFRQYCHVGNTTQHCRWGSFQDSDFAGAFEDSRATSGHSCKIFGTRTFVPNSWMCKKQASVSDNSTTANGWTCSRPLERSN